VEYTLDDVLEELLRACNALKAATERHSRTGIEDAVNWIGAIINEHKKGPYEKQTQNFYDEYINIMYEERAKTK
jgi:hypothetical protein